MKDPSRNHPLHFPKNIFPYYLYLEGPPSLRGGKDGMSDSQPRPLKSLVEQQNGRYDCFYTFKLMNSVNFVFCLCRSNPQDTLMEKTRTRNYHLLI